MTAAVDPYRVLGVDPGASAEEVHRAYRVLAREYHPDHNPHRTRAGARMAEINAAYQCLSDPVRRRDHDRRRQVVEPAAWRQAVLEAAGAGLAQRDWRRRILGGGDALFEQPSRRALVRFVDVLDERLLDIWIRVAVRTLEKGIADLAVGVAFRIVCPDLFEDRVRVGARSIAGIDLVQGSHLGAGFPDSAYAGLFAPLIFPPGGPR